jgi:hypothetical protein
METILKYINKILGILPFNGKKTWISILLLGISFILKQSGLEIPVDLSTVDPDAVHTSVVNIVESITHLLDILGFTGISIGLAHKGTKSAEKVLNKPMWEK